jgi:phage N-6-adenine-methyltransferase
LLGLPLQSGLGASLRHQRKSMGLTQAELAGRAGLSIPTIRLLESGRGNLDSWQAALDALGLEVTGRNISSTGSLGHRLAELRRQRGLSQRELAKSAGVNQSTIVALERSGSGRLDVLERVGRILGAGLYLAAKGSGRAFYTHAGNSSNGQRWETPAELLSALYRVFGRFDLDPCSPRKTKPPVRARVHYTAEDDGLTLPWHGVVFLNPPYGRTLGRWIAKARHEVEAGNVKTAVALIPSRTDTTYWHAHVAGRAVVYFLRGRLRFSSSEQGAPFPSALVIWGAVPEIIKELDQALPDAWRAG